jgi:DNA-binding NtrC family response regulator
MAGSKSDSCVSALLVGEYPDDRAFLRGIFRDAGWRLWEASDQARALACLASDAVQVVLSETDGPGWHWGGLFHDLKQLVYPPQLIITSRTADDYLWAEVLNIGGYDVLQQPFNRDEVERVVAGAHRHFERFARGVSLGAPLSASGAA